jgi:hypothetical protein
MPKKVKKMCIQRHHPDYDNYPNLTFAVYQGEHWQITKLDRKFRLSKHKPYSLGFLKALAYFINLYGHGAVDLDRGMNE